MTTDGGLSTGAKAGIAVGVAFACLLPIAGAFLLFLRYRRSLRSRRFLDRRQASQPFGHDDVVWEGRIGQAYGANVQSQLTLFGHQAQDYLTGPVDFNTFAQDPLFDLEGHLSQNDETAPRTLAQPSARSPLEQRTAASSSDIPTTSSSPGHLSSTPPAETSNSSHGRLTSTSLPEAISSSPTQHPSTSPPEASSSSVGDFPFISPPPQAVLLTAHRCSICGKHYPSARRLTAHIRRHTLPESCPDCGVGVADKKELDRHRARLHGVMVLDCPAPNCQYSTGRRDALVRHINSDRHRARYGQVSIDT